MNTHSSAPLGASPKVWSFFQIVLLHCVLSTIYTGVLNLEIATTYPGYYTRRALPFLPLYESQSVTALAWTGIHLVFVIAPISLCFATAAVVGDGPSVTWREIRNIEVPLILVLGMVSSLAGAVGRTIGQSLLSNRFEMLQDISTLPERSMFLGVEFQGLANTMFGLLGCAWLFIYIMRLRRKREL